MNRSLDISIMKKVSVLLPLSLIDYRVKNILSSLHTEINYLLSLKIDGSVLKNSDIVTSLKKIFDIRFPEFKQHEVYQSTKILLTTWESQVSSDNSKSTIEALQGGNIVNIPIEDLSQDVIESMGISYNLWKKLRMRYNTSQLFALRYVLEMLQEPEANGIALIQGPPGTGKTSTIIGMLNIILNCFQSTSTSTISTSNSYYQRILLCTPSNSAIDELLTRLENSMLDREGNLHSSSSSIRIVRLGEPLANASENIISYTLDRQVELEVASSPLVNLLKDVDMKINELLIELQSLSSNHHNMNSIKYELHKLKESKKYYETAIERVRLQSRCNILSQANIICSTLSSSGKQQFQDFIIKTNSSYPLCIIDEACQATEPSLLIPLRYRCNKLILIGDPRQLPSTILSMTNTNAGLGMSLFERLEKCQHEVVMLTTQYRMHPIIRSFISTKFYHNKLHDSSSIQQEVNDIQFSQAIIDSNVSDFIKSTNVSLPPSISLMGLQVINFFNTHTISCDTMTEERHGTSYFNDNEVWFIANLLHQLNTSTCLQDMSIGIITPYKAQVHRMKSYLSRHTNSYVNMNIEINSIDAFQGREKDLIIYSAVRTKGSTQFLSDKRRFNVAMTRCKRCLIIIGDYNLLQEDVLWKEFIHYIYKHGLVADIYKISKCQRFKSLNSNDNKVDLNCINDFTWEQRNNS